MGTRYDIFFKQCSSFCWFLLLGPHTYLTSNITLERLRPHKCKWTDIMTLTGIFIQRMFPETQLRLWGWLIDFSYISVSYKMKAPPSLTRDSASATGQEGGGSCFLSGLHLLGEGVGSSRLVVNTAQRHMRGISTQVLINLYDTTVCPLTVIKTIIIDCLFCL